MIVNYHTHTNLCDGKNSVEEIVVKAMELGLTEIGFSGHSHAPWDKTCQGMDEGKLQKYFEQIEYCRAKYPSVKIYCGIELDYYSKVDTSKFDYIIGAVHYVKKGGEFIPVDLSKEVLVDAVNRLYNGNFNEFLSDYYCLVADLYNKTKCNIIAHIDLVTKLNKNEEIFSQSGAIYQNLAISCVNKLVKEPCFFEINTGAISRGYKTEFYPQEFILDEIAKSGKPFILSSDCHDKQNLLFGFCEAKEILDKKGYGVVTSLKDIL